MKRYAGRWARFRWRKHPLESSSQESCYRDRAAILRAARETENPQFENHKISIYPDYTQKVQDSRKSYLEVKRKLREMDIKYMLLYPAKLRVIHAGKSYFFKHPNEVWNWLDMADKIPLHTMSNPDPFHAYRQERPRGN